MYKLEHIGIAVRTLEKSDELFERLLHSPPYKHETVEEQGVITSFFMAGESKIELLEPLHDQSPIYKFIEKKGEGIHHIAFEVEDIRLEMDRLRNEGFQLLNEEPAVGADRKWVCFIHPRSANGVLIELCQSIPEDTTSPAE